jgi:nucleoside-diphosphate-sugar epimerase
MGTTHTIFGAGQVGLPLAKLLAARGHRVRLVRRGPAGPDIAGVTWLSGDASDPAFADQACDGADVVYNCANPADYHRWHGVLEPLYRSIWAAAERAGARIVQLDNLYAYGRPSASPFDERTANEPCSDKGVLRKLLADELLAMHQQGRVVAAIGRASDFFGPDTPNGAIFRPDVYARIAAGKSVVSLGDPDMPHSYSYTPDVARGLAVLGEHDAAPGRIWHLPVAAQLSTRQLVDRFAARAGTSVRVWRLPTWLVRTIGVVSPLLRAIAEMAYQWELPYLVDDADFRRTFAVGPTDLDAAIDTTLRAHSSPAPSDGAAALAV